MSWKIGSIIKLQPLDLGIIHSQQLNLDSKLLSQKESTKQCTL